MLLRDEGEEATDAGLSAIADRLKSQPEAKDSLQQLASAFLERLPRTTGEMTTYSWGLVARAYAQERAEVIAGIILDTLATTDRYFREGHDVTAILALTTRAEPHRVWDRVGDLLLRVDRESFRVQMTLEGWFVGNVDPEIPLRWADEHRPRGPGIVASLTIPDGTPLATLPRELLRRFHDDERVAERLYGNLVSGGHWGNTSTWLEAKLALAQQWMLDPDAHVAAWGRHTADSLEKWAQRERLREEEDELRR